MIEVYKTHNGWQFRVYVHGVVLLESVYFYATRLEAARVVAELLRAGKHFMVPATFPRVLFTDANNRAISVDLSGEGNAS